MPSEFPESSAAAATISEFIYLYLDIYQKGATGTLRVNHKNGPRPAILFIDGKIVDMDPGDGSSILVQAILATGKISNRDLKKARKQAGEENSPSLGIWLFEQNIAPQEEVLGKLQEVLTDKICELFGAVPESVEFISHQTDERLEDFSSELSELFELQFEAEDFFLEALRRLDRWDVVQQSLQNLWDIYYATPNAMRYYGDAQNCRQEIAILGHVDGLKDLETIIASSSCNPFEAFRLLKHFIAENDISILNPVQVFQIGSEALEGQEYQKAWRCFKRAFDRGLNDFDIRLKLGEASEALGHNDRASAYYLEFAESCQGLSRIKDATRTYQKAADLNPLDSKLQFKVLSLLVEQGRKEDAIAFGLRASAGLEEGEDERHALDLLLTLKKNGWQDPKVKSRIHHLAEICGDQRVLQEHASQEERSQKVETEDALKSIQRQFCEGNDSIEVRLKLVEMHQKRKQNAKVLEHLNGILGTPLESQVNDAEVLAWLHETRLNLAPGHFHSSRWLADNHLKAGRRSEALAVYSALVQHLEKEKEIYLLIEACKQMALIDAENLKPRFQLARLYSQLGKFKEYAAEVERIAKVATAQKDQQSLQAAWSEVFMNHPFIRQTLVVLSEALDVCGSREEADGRRKSIAGLDLICGQTAEAEALLKKLSADESPICDLGGLLGEQQLKQGNKVRGLELLGQAARANLQRKDLHAARVLIAKILAENPKDKTGGDLRKELELFEARLKNEAPRAAAPGSASVRIPRAAAAPPAAAVTPAPHAPAAQAPAAPAPVAAAIPAAAAVPGPSPAPIAAPTPPLATQQFKEPFQPRPVSNKGTVAAITARLRNLKTIEPAGGKVGAKAEEGGAAAAQEPAPQAAGRSGVKIQGMRGVASKLKALASMDSAAPSSGDEPAAQPPPAPSAEAAPPPEPAGEAVKAGKPGSVAVRKDGSVAVRKSAAEGGLSSDAEARLAKTAQNSGGVKINKSLGGSASKLAQLKKKPAEKSPQPDVQNTSA